MGSKTPRYHQTARGNNQELFGGYELHRFLHVGILCTTTLPFLDVSVHQHKAAHMMALAVPQLAAAHMRTVAP